MKFDFKILRADCTGMNRELGNTTTWLAPVREVTAVS